MNMLYFNKNNIELIKFDVFFNDIVNENGKEDSTEFFGVTGKEHYRLLTYVSTLFNNSNILIIIIVKIICLLCLFKYFHFNI